MFIELATRDSEIEGPAYVAVTDPATCVAELRRLQGVCARTNVQAVELTASRFARLAPGSEVYPIHLTLRVTASGEFAFVAPYLPEAAIVASESTSRSVREFCAEVRRGRRYFAWEAGALKARVRELAAAEMPLAA